MIHRGEAPAAATRLTPSTAVHANKLLWARAAAIVGSWKIPPLSPQFVRGEPNIDEPRIDRICGEARWTFPRRRKQRHIMGSRGVSLQHELGNSSGQSDTDSLKILASVVFFILITLSCMWNASYLFTGSVLDASAAGAENGEVGRQILFIILFLLLIFSIYRQRGLGLLMRIPNTFRPILIWCC